MSESVQPHGLQHTRLPCPSLSPRVCSTLCLLSQWFHPTISSSVVPFSSCPQSFPASGSFPTSRLFESGGQSIGVSTSASVLPMNFWGWFPLELMGLSSLLSKGLSRVPSPVPQFKSSSSSELSLLYGPTLTSVRDYWKNHSFDYVDLCQTWPKVMSLLFNTLSRFAIAFLPRSKQLSISWLQSPSAVILEPNKM